MAITDRAKVIVPEHPHADTIAAIMQFLADQKLFATKQALQSEL
jgi:hypothetical protein